LRPASAPPNTDSSGRKVTGAYPVLALLSAFSRCYGTRVKRKEGPAGLQPASARGRQRPTGQTGARPELAKSAGGTPCPWQLPTRRQGLSVGPARLRVAGRPARLLAGLSHFHETAAAPLRRLSHSLQRRHAAIGRRRSRSPTSRPPVQQTGDTRPLALRTRRRGKESAHLRVGGESEHFLVRWIPRNRTRRDTARWIALYPVAARSQSRSASVTACGASGAVKWPARSTTRSVVLGIRVVRQLVAWLHGCGVTTVALEATGAYGQVLFLVPAGRPQGHYGGSPHAGADRLQPHALWSRLHPADRGSLRRASARAP
jgi:hypothetical protein